MLQIELMSSTEVSSGLRLSVLETLITKCRAVTFLWPADAVVERTPLFVLLTVTAILPSRFTWLRYLIMTLIRKRALVVLLYLILTTCLGRLTRFPMPG